MAGRGTQATYPEAFAAFARYLAEAGGPHPTIERIVARSVDIVPCGWAAIGVAQRLGDRPPVLAAMTDPSLMETVATIAGGVGSSPGLSAFRQGTKAYAADLTRSPEWSGYASQMVHRTPIRSVLSFGLRLHARPLGVLTFYSSVAEGFDEAAQRRGALLADHATIAIDAATAAESARGLQVALCNSRVIGVATGVLAERHGISPTEAFDLLRVVSNHTNRKLSDLAEELMSTGELPDRS